MSCASLGRSTAAGFLCTTRPKSSAATCNTASSKDSSPLISFRSLRSDCPAAGQFHADCNARSAAPPASRLPKSRREILRCMIHLPRSMLVLMASDSRAAEQPDEIAASHGRPSSGLGPHITTPLWKNAAVHYSKNCALMSQMGSKCEVFAKSKGLPVYPHHTFDGATDTTVSCH